MKYNYVISKYNERFNKLYYMILDYELEGKIKQEDIIAGYISDCLIYESKKGDIYGSDIYERTTGIKIDRIDGTADGHFYDGEFTL